MRVYTRSSHAINTVQSEMQKSTEKVRVPQINTNSPVLRTPVLHCVLFSNPCSLYMTPFSDVKTEHLTMSRSLLSVISLPPPTPPLSSLKSLCHDVMVFDPGWKRGRGGKGEKDCDICRARGREGRRGGGRVGVRGRGQGFGGIANHPSYPTTC